MNPKKLLIVLLAIIGFKLILNLTFKIQYSPREYYDISGFSLNDSTQIEVGKVLFGKNIKGEIEAIVYPDNFIRNGKNMDIEYVYMRFYPDWFSENLKPYIKKSQDRVTEDLMMDTRYIHDENFRNFMHINEYPLVKKDYLPVVIKWKGNDKKERLIIEQYI
ncbi:hypothetical protein OAO55_00560 [Bacteroidales bacterium]|nr:hypothetical protein [Bacteroidales bacterium]